MQATSDLTGTELREQQRGLDKLELALPQRKSQARRIWSAVWPKVAAVALCGVHLAAGRVERLEVGGHPPGSCHRLRDALPGIRHADGSRVADAATRVRRLRPLDHPRNRDRRRRRTHPRVARGGGIDDHRPPDDAVDRMVPGRDRAVPAQRGRDPLRGRDRRHALDRQRAASRGSTPFRRSCCAPGACSARVAWQRSVTSSSRPRCRRSWPASSRGGRSRGAACSPASCSC